MSSNKFVIKSKDSLVDILEQAGAVFDGDNCTCPFHDDRNPSGGIYRDGGHWRFRCFVCDITLDYWDILARHENLDIAEVLRMEPKEERTQHVYENYQDALGEYTARYEYFDLDSKLLVTKIRIFDNETNKKSYRMISPYYGGYIRKGPQPPWPLYNLPGLNVGGKRGLVIVEGEKCVDALRELGFPVTTALSSTSVSQTDWSPVYGRDIVIWPDNDPTGYKYANAVDQILKPYCKVTRVDPIEIGLVSKEDVVDYIERGHGSEDIRAVLQEASIRTSARGVWDYINGMIDGSIMAVEWPWPMLQRFSQALLPGTITVLVGPPGSSKSLMLTEALSYWIDNDIKVALHVLEENKTFHLLRALAQRSEVAGITEPEWVKAHPQEARAIWTSHAPYLDTIGKHLYAQPEKQTNLSEIIDWITEQLEAGCRIVAVDPITAAGRTKDVWKADEEFILCSKKLADKYHASLIFVTHPTKQDAQPYLGNMRGGAAWQQFVQNVFWLEKLQGTQHVSLIDGTMVRVNRMVHILKARNAREMTTGKIAYSMTKGLRFHEHGEFAQFED